MFVPEWSGGIDVHVGSEPSSVPLLLRPAPVSDTTYTHQNHMFSYKAVPVVPQFQNSSSMTHLRLCLVSCSPAVVL